MIAGSRITTPEMIELVNRIIYDMQAIKCHILVGDAPGIDEAVINACDLLGIGVTVHGIYSVGRNESKQFNSYKHVVAPSYLKARDKLIFRDRYMVDHCDKYVGICLNNSHGTMSSLGYAKSTGKSAEIHHFSS